MKNSKGNISIFLLFILIIVSILSIGAYQFVYSAAKNAHFNEDSTQSYYIAKAAADIVIENIDKVNKNLSVNGLKQYNMSFSDGTAEVTVKKKSSNQLELHSIGNVNESERTVKAIITFNSSESLEVFAVSENKKYAKVYRLQEADDGTFEAIEVSDIPEMKYPKAFTWNNGDTLILVGGGNGKKELKTLVYDIINEQWKGTADSGGNYGNALVYATYGEDTGEFYGIEGNNNGNGNGNGKILKFDSENYKWELYWNNTKNFKGEKLAWGNNTIVLINDGYEGVLYYVNKDDNKSGKIYINGYGMECTYESVIFNNGKFVVVGYENDDWPVIIYSYDGVKWNGWTLIQDETYEINYELNDVTWTGNKFVAVGGADTIVQSDDGENWAFFPRKNINKHEDLIGYGNYISVSGYNNYIISVNDNSNRVLYSKDGGETWIETKLYGVEGQLIDVIIIRGDGSDATKDFSIKWTE